MATAREARQWAPGALRGIIDSLYTPFDGPGGERIDFDALRALIRYCLEDLGHDGIWVGGLVGECWALSVVERKELLEVAIAEARAARPGVLVEACPASTNVLETVDLTRHAAEVGRRYLLSHPAVLRSTGLRGGSGTDGLCGRANRHCSWTVQHSLPRVGS